MHPSRYSIDHPKVCLVPHEHYNFTMQTEEYEIYAPRGEDAPNPVLCFQTRSGITENVHRGVICCVEALDDTKYRIVHQAGNIDQLFFPRSAVKYVQVLPLLESGCVEHFRLTPEEIAVMCASHNATPDHVRVVRSILSKAGVDESDLNCGGHTPGCEVSAWNYVREGVSTPFRDHIYNNCSGKHAGFLALCKYKGYPIQGYLEHDHPVQVLVRESISYIFCIPLTELRMGTDGCNAPAPIMSVRHAALGYARLCHSAVHKKESLRLAITTMMSALAECSSMVYGTQGFDSVLMKQFAGKIIGKRGAAGVFLSGIVGHAVGVAVKIDDGVMTPQYNVTMQMLQWIYSGARVDHTANGTESDSSGGSLLPHIAKDTEECAAVLERLGEMGAFLVTPSFNAIGVKVGALSCTPMIFDGASVGEVRELLC